MSTKAPRNTTAEQAIYQLTAEARTHAKKDRRADIRYAFFRPVSICVNGHSYSAFSREISTSAIGLLHDMELPLCDVEISIPMEAGEAVKVATRIERCEPCGSGWYLSCGEFITTPGKGQQSKGRT